jgi:transposase
MGGFMPALSPAQRILLAVNAVDFRKSIDGLIGLCRRQLDENPQSGTLFVFTNRRRTALKPLIYDGQGYYVHKSDSTGFATRAHKFPQIT